MSPILHLAFGFCVIGASAAGAYQFSRMADESGGKHECGRSVQASKRGGLLGVSRSAIPSGSAANNKPFGLENRDKLAIGRIIADKLRAKIATGILHDSVRANPNHQQRGVESYE